MSKQSIPLLSLTIVAAGAVAAFRGVGFNGAQATVQGQKIQGVARGDAAITEQLTLDSKGTLIVESGAAIAVGDALIMDAQGRAIPSTGALAVKAGAVAMTSTAANGAVLQGGDAPEFVFADALEAATGAGEFIEVLAR